MMEVIHEHVKIAMKRPAERQCGSNTCKEITQTSQLFFTRVMPLPFRSISVSDTLILRYQRRGEMKTMEAIVSFIS